MSVDPRRRLALEVLLAVRRGRALDAELARARRKLGAEAGVLEELVKGALQWQGRYDFLVARFSRRQASPDEVVRGVLHLALHQLLTSTGVPAYAAVHQAGELLRAERKPRAVGYANAVLQAVVRHVESAETDTPLRAVHELFLGPELAVADYLAAWWSHPRWLVERWLERFGDAETAQLLEHANQPAPITLHVLPGHDPTEALATLAAAGTVAAPVAGFPRALRLAERLDRARLRELLTRIPGLLVQDAGAQAALDWLTRDGADLAEVLVGPVVDLCAAPGGKAAHLRALLADQHAVVAMDLRPRRLKLVRENRDRLGQEGMPLVAADGSQPPLRPGSCAAVLVDGPCSGTGVGRHHPEGRWRLRPDTLQRNAERLRVLATSAAELLVPGGRLYYATCSLEPEENEQVVAAVLDATGGLEPDPDPDGRFQRTWLPWRHDSDGFFAARLRRRRESKTGDE